MIFECPKCHHREEEEPTNLLCPKCGALIQPRLGDDPAFERNRTHTREEF